MILAHHNVELESIDLSECISEDAMHMIRLNMEERSGSSDLPQLFLHGNFLGAGTEALEFLMYLNDAHEIENFTGDD